MHNQLLLATCTRQAKLLSFPVPGGFVYPPRLGAAKLLGQVTMNEVIKFIQQMTAAGDFDGYKIYPPATPEQIKELGKKTAELFKANLPDAYAQFLQAFNGFDWNGFVVFGTHPYSEGGPPGFIEMNESLRDVPHWKNFLVIGETGDDCYCFRLADSQYCVVELISRDLVQEYDNFSEMFLGTLHTLRN
jgi:hypothetical protein